MPAAPSPTKSPASRSRGVHYVYLVSNQSRNLKIGHTSNPRGRLSSLATASAERLTVEHVFTLPSRAEAVALEKRLHDMFRTQRTFREWHNVSACEVKCVAEALLAGEDDRAEMLAEALANMFEDWAEHDKLTRRLKATSARWRPEDRAHLEREVDGACQEALASWRRAKELGYTPAWTKAAPEPLPKLMHKRS